MLTLADVHSQVDLLVMLSTGLSIYIQDYENPEELVLEFDDGEPHAALPLTTPVEVNESGVLFINDVGYLAYVTQQVKFEPTKE